MWKQNGDTFENLPKGNEVGKLPVGVYTLNYGAFGSMHLEKIKDSFKFPYKLYGKDTFPSRVISTFNDSSNYSNLGVMLTGIKGTGKSVDAAQICNLSKLPVVLIGENFDDGKDLVSYLSTVKQDLVIFIDEYEKIFKQSDGLLSVMDGAQTTNARRLFLLTSNSLRVSEALLDRPSRIYYLKRYTNLHAAVIGEIVDDMLAYPKLRGAVVSYIGSLELITIDIVKTVLKEVNRFGEHPKQFQDILNVTVRDTERWLVTEVEKGESIIKYGTSSYLDPFGKKGSSLEFQELGGENKYLGEIKYSNRKTGRITTTYGVYYVRQAKAMVIPPFGSAL